MLPGGQYNIEVFAYSQSRKSFDGLRIRERERERKKEEEGPHTYTQSYGQAKY